MDTPRYRIGNDLTVLWAICNRDGSPFNLDGKRVKLFVVNERGREEVEPIITTLPDGTTNNVIRWDFKAEEQKVLGSYALSAEISITEDSKVIKKDYSEAFNLVSRSEQESEDEGDMSMTAEGDLYLTSKLDVFRFGIPKIEINTKGHWTIDGVDSGQSALGGGQGLVNKIYNESDFDKEFDNESVIDTFNASAIAKLHRQVVAGPTFSVLNPETDNIFVYRNGVWMNIPAKELVEFYAPATGGGGGFPQDMWFYGDDGRLYTTKDVVVLGNLGVGGPGLGGNGEGAQVVTALSELTDVSIYNPKAGEILVYEGGKWINKVFSVDIPVMPDLEGYATEAWVERQGYVKATDIADPLSKIETFSEWFEWADEEHTTIRTKYNFFSQKQIAVGEKGEADSPASGGGITGIQVNGNIYNDADEFGIITLPNYPTELRWESVTGRPTKLTDFENDLDLSAYAGRQYVDDTFYTKEAAIVLSQGLTASQEAINKLNVLLEWFKYDSVNDAVYTDKSFYSKLQLAAGERGENASAGGGTITGIRVNGKDYASPDEYGILTIPDYPTSLNWDEIIGRPTDLGQFTNEAGYIKSNALEGYATKAWVEAKQYALASNVYDKDAINQKEKDLSDRIAPFEKWFREDSAGNLYTTYNFYSTKQLATGEAGAAHEGEGGGGRVNGIIINGTEYVEVDDYGNLIVSETLATLDDLASYLKNTDADNKFATKTYVNDTFATITSLGGVDERLKEIEEYFNGSGEDADNKINKWNEIVAFLNATEDTTLAGILAAYTLKTDHNALAERVTANEGAISGINTTLGSHTSTLSEHTTAINTLGSKVNPIDTWFNEVGKYFKKDSDGVWYVDGSFYTKGQNAAGAVGSPDGGGSSGSGVMLLESWSDVPSSLSGYALSAALGIDLHERFGNYYTIGDVDSRFSGINSRLATLDSGVADRYTKAESDERYYQLGGAYTEIKTPGPFAINALGSWGSFIPFMITDLSTGASITKAIVGWQADAVRVTHIQKGTMLELRDDGIIRLVGSGNTQLFMDSAEAALSYIGTNAIRINSDGAFYNQYPLWHRGNLTSLSQLTDDVVAGKYLPLSGGMIESTLYRPLSLNYAASSIPTSAYIEYGLVLDAKSKLGSFGWGYTRGVYMELSSNVVYRLGIKIDGTPYYDDNTLIHSGNIGRQGVYSAQALKNSNGTVGATAQSSGLVSFASHIVPNNDSQAYVGVADKAWYAVYTNGLWAPSGKTLYLGANNSNHIIVNTSGNVAINNTLSVSSTSTFSGLTTHNAGISTPHITIGGITLSVVDGVLRIDGNVHTTGQLGVGAVGQEGGGTGGGGVLLLNTWPTDGGSYAGYALGGNLGIDLNTRVKTLEGKATAVSFSQTLTSGKQIGVLTIDGSSEVLYAPSTYAWSEITSRPSKLSDFTDDVVSGKYLSLSGGTISGNLAVDGHIIKSGHFFGVNNNDNAEWYVTDKNWQNTYTLIHSGNIASQSVASAKKLVTSGGVEYASTDGSTYTALGLHSAGTYINGKQCKITYGDSGVNGFILNTSGNVTIGASDLAGTSAKLYVDGHIKLGSTGYLYKGDKTIIDFNGEAPLFGYGTAKAGLETYVYGNVVRLYYGGVSNIGFILNSSGNVGIGTTNPAYKLDVAGTARISGATTLSSTLAVSGLVTASSGIKIGSILLTDENGTLKIAGNAYTTGQLGAGEAGQPTSGGGSVILDYDSIVDALGFTPASSSQLTTLGNRVASLERKQQWELDSNGVAFTTDAGMVVPLGTTHILGLDDAGQCDLTVGDSSYVTRLYGSSILANGSEVLTKANTSFTRSYASGTKIGTIKIGGTSTDIYVPASSSSSLWTTEYDMENDIDIIASQKEYIGTNTIVGWDSAGTCMNDLYIGFDGYTIWMQGSVDEASDMRLKTVIDAVNLDIRDIAFAPIFNYVFKSRPQGRQMLGSSAQYWQPITPCAVSENDKGNLAMNYGAIALASVVAVAKKTLTCEEDIAELKLKVQSFENRLARYELN